MRGAIRFVAGCCLLTAHIWTSIPQPAPSSPPPDRTAAVQNKVIQQSPEKALPHRLDLYLQAYVTGYNTVAGQTDGAPCIAASGANICGRHDTVACPPLLPLGAVVEINGKRYICEDRMARKFSGRFDINCDKDMRCPYRVAGWATVKVLFE
jgi:hypothetical protein